MCMPAEVCGLWSIKLQVHVFEDFIRKRFVINYKAFLSVSVISW